MSGISHFAAIANQRTSLLALWRNQDDGWVSVTDGDQAANFGILNANRQSEAAGLHFPHMKSREANVAQYFSWHTWFDISATDYCACSFSRNWTFGRAGDWYSRASTIEHRSDGKQPCA